MLLIFSHEKALSRYPHSDYSGRDSGVAAIESLISRRGTFDYIILETSGLADPGNLAPLFWVDDGLGSTIYLDGIVTLIDAKNILLSLDEPPAPDVGDQHEGAHMTTAHLQISHADVLVINKSDSVTPDHLATVEARVRAINGLAKIHMTQYGQIPQLEGFLLDLHAYDGIDGLDTTSTAAHSHIDPVRLHTPPHSPTHPLTTPTLGFSTDHINPHTPPPAPFPLPTSLPHHLAPVPPLGLHPPPPLTIQPATILDPPPQRPHHHPLRPHEDDPRRTRGLRDRRPRPRPRPRGGGPAAATAAGKRKNRNNRSRTSGLTS